MKHFKFNPNIFLAFALAGCLTCGVVSCTDEENNVNTGEIPTNLSIVKEISAHRPSVTGAPSNLRSILGATHVNGQYYLTDEPYLIEGARKLNQLGYGLLKLWFYKADGDAHGYKYNSPDWNLTEDMTLKELAQHKYYVEAFDMPFEVFCLNINDGWPSNSTEDLTEEYARVEAEFYELTTYLLETYQDRSIKFLLSN